MKNLYHGSIYDFDRIDLSKGRGYKDFGKGFYATAYPDHADRIARRNKNIALKRQEILQARGLIKKPEPIIAYRYNLLFDEELASELNVRRFTFADREWLRFVMINRHARELSHGYDIVIGPTADAQTSMLLNTYQDDLIESDFDEDLCQKVISELMPENLPKQYFFGTEAVVKTLRFDKIRRRVIG